MAELFGGGIPYASLTEPQVVMCILQGDSVTSLLLNIDTALRPILDACWQLDPLQRPSMDAIVDMVAAIPIRDSIVPPQVIGLRYS